MGYTKDAVKGISWLGGYRLFYRFLSIARIPIILRILSPVQYGVYSVALLVLGFIEVITETGINIVLLQEKDDVDAYIDTAWVVSIVRGIIISAVIIISAKWIALFFHSPQSYHLLLLTSIIPFLRGFINPSVAKFVKDLEYNKEFIYRSTIILIDTIFSLIFVFILKSPVALLYGMLAGVIGEVIISYILAKPLPQFVFKKTIFNKIIHRGKWLTSAIVLNYLYQNLDNIIVGRILGPFYLGIYDRSYTISLLPITEISDVITQATLPVYVKISSDKARLRRAFLRTTALILALVIPVGIIFYFFSEPLISLLMGPKWIQAAPVLQVLAFFGVVRAIALSANSFFISRQKQTYSTIIIMVSLVGMLATIVPFIHIWKVTGAGLAAITGTVISLPFAVYYIMKILHEKENT